jgi:spore germination cell wall hydrolase CwlJ-like protein
MVKGELRIIAKSAEEAEELAGYLWRVTNGAAWFYAARQGRNEWLCYGEIELPPDEDTRTKEQHQ